MARTTRRPFGVSFSIIWAVLLAGLLMTRAAGRTMVPAVVPEAAVSGMALAATQVALATVLLFAALCVFKLVSWGRRLAIVAFVLAGIATVGTAVDGSLFGFVVVALDATAAFMLVMHADAFRSKRPEIDDSGSATSFGTR